MPRVHRGATADTRAKPEEVVARSAAPATEQPRYSAKLGVTPSPAELAREFGELPALAPNPVARRRLTPEQAAALAAVERQRAALSDERALWTEEAPRAHPDRAAVRRLAAASLRAMGRPAP